MAGWPARGADPGGRGPTNAPGLRRGRRGGLGARRRGVGTVGERGEPGARRAAGPARVRLCGGGRSQPVVVGQIETPIEQPLPDVVAGLDVVFVGTTDVAVSLGYGPGDARLAAAVTAIGAAATTAGVAFGGWSASLAAAGEQG